MIIKLPDGTTSAILTNESIASLPARLKGEQVFVLTDRKVYSLYGNAFPPNEGVIVLPDGEKNKTLDTVAAAVRQLIAKGADRKSFILGIGGGIVCDITGFVASIYMRGLRFGFVPTTLLAQVDASVGGKNGVNCDGYKNMIGVFNQPEFVLCDVNMLDTLDCRQLKAGLAEVIKSALIADAELFRYLENNIASILNLDKNQLRFIVERSIAIKAQIVEADEREAGERKKLNLGHTIGHAIEKQSNNKFLHGEAVSIGMAMAAYMSARVGMLSESELKRILHLLEWAGLPLSAGIPTKKLVEAVGKDKKKHGNTVSFIFNKGIGNVEIKDISITNYEWGNKNLQL
ncbi:MAG: 3-dehydroquinate synthase [Prevotellaceae bacterium]|jgi:3-dehydroquinate synthase|nr:3-dehydroquinate synthase [Prevotellaceae bacterium]